MTMKVDVVLFCCMLIFFTRCEVPSELTCRKGWTKLDTRCYLFVATQNSWQDGQQSCRETDAELVSISNEKEYELLQDHLFKTYPVLKRWWLGLSRDVTETIHAWKWLDGSEFDNEITPWSDSSQPSLTGQRAGLGEITSNKIRVSAENMDSPENLICERPLENVTTTTASTSPATSSTTTAVAITTTSLEITTSQVITTTSATTNITTAATTIPATPSTPVTTVTSATTSTPKTLTSSVTTMTIIDAMRTTTLKVRLELLLQPDDKLSFILSRQVQLTDGTALVQKGK
ncbi:cell wall protein DAN4 isoform X2 [Biomphalaria glabrata]|nr:cell wall protein DAN4 isoform X2 [Biomphalaria glabrata]